jgi:hypothetical protein
MDWKCRVLRAATRTIGFAALLCLAGAASAGLIGSSVTASLVSPGDGIDAVDSGVLIGNGIEIEPGNAASNIAPFLFTSTAPDGSSVSEYIDFFDTGVTLRIAGADPSGSGATGYAAGAHYVFSGLDFLGGGISGIGSVVLSFNISNFPSTPEPTGCTEGVCFDTGSSSITVFLDQVIIGPDGNLPAPMGLVTINLETFTSPPNGAPEPGSVLLVAIGFLGLILARLRALS